MDPGTVILSAALSESSLAPQTKMLAGLLLLQGQLCLSQ